MRNVSVFFIQLCWTAAARAESFVAVFLIGVDTSENGPRKGLKTDILPKAPMLISTNENWWDIHEKIRYGVRENEDSNILEPSMPREF